MGLESSHLQGEGVSPSDIVKSDANKRLEQPIHIYPRNDPSLSKISKSMYKIQENAQGAVMKPPQWNTANKLPR